MSLLAEMHAIGGDLTGAVAAHRPRTPLNTGLIDSIGGQPLASTDSEMRPAPPAIPVVAGYRSLSKMTG